MNYKYEDRIIAFIDILGFSSIIKNTISSEIVLTNLGNALDYIQRYFDQIKQNYEDQSILGLTQFSDSLVISVSMKDSFEMLKIFKHLKKIQINLADKNILMRGGIVKGKLIHTDKLLLGPGMINAYNLESKCALHPRIVIDPRVLWQFARVNGVKGKQRLMDFDYEKSFASEKDGTYYIDYFNDVKDYIEFSGGVHSYFRTICSMIAKYVDAEDISVRVKYLWLREKLKSSEYFSKYKTVFKGVVTNRNRGVKTK